MGFWWDILCSGSLLRLVLGWKMWGLYLLFCVGFIFLSLNTCMKLCLYSSNLCVHMQTRTVLYSSVASLNSLAKVKPGVLTSPCISFSSSRCYSDQLFTGLSLIQPICLSSGLIVFFLKYAIWSPQEFRISFCCLFHGVVTSSVDGKFHLYPDLIHVFATYPQLDYPYI